MQVKFNGFPVVYFYAVCQKHHAQLAIRIEEAKPFQSDVVTGGQITTLSCSQGGVECQSDWKIIFNAPGEVVIAN